MNTGNFHQLEYEGWQRVAGFYKDTWATLTTRFISLLVNAIRIGAGMKVLDVACGPGYVANAAAEKGAIATGLDFSPEMIRQARMNFPGINFVEGNAQSLPFEENSFDAVLMNFGLLHLPSPETAMKEACRVLKKGGQYGYTIWAPPAISEGAKIMTEAIERFGKKGIADPQAPDYYIYCSEEASKDVLSKAGFEKSSVHFKTIPDRWPVPDENFWFEAELNAGVRTAYVLKQQDEISLGQIRKAVINGIQKFKTENGYEIPFTAHLVTAVK
jgi:ubiquinone/menaquinone biosynthesis C-methylase UbiE